MADTGQDFFTGRSGGVIVKPDMLERGNGQNQIKSFGGIILNDVRIDHTRRYLVLIDDGVPGWKVMAENIADFENPATARSSHKALPDGHLDHAFAAPGHVVAVVKAGKLLSPPGERFGS